MNVKYTALLLAILSGLLIAAGNFPEHPEGEQPVFIFPENEYSEDEQPVFLDEAQSQPTTEEVPAYKQFGDFYQSLEDKDLVYFNMKWYRKEKVIQAKVTAY